MTQERRGFTTGDFAVLLFVLVITVPAAQLLHRRALELAALEKERDTLKLSLLAEQEKQRELMREREALLSDKVFIEKQARENLGLQREGETVLPAGVKAAGSGEPERAVPEDRWLDRAMRHRMFPVALPAAVLGACVAFFALWHALAPAVEDALEDPD